MSSTIECSAGWSRGFRAFAMSCGCPRTAGAERLGFAPDGVLSGGRVRRDPQQVARRPAPRQEDLARTTAQRPVPNPDGASLTGIIKGVKCRHTARPDWLDALRMEAPSGARRAA